MTTPINEHIMDLRGLYVQCAGVIDSAGDAIVAFDEGAGLDGILGGNTPAAATVTTLTTGGAVVMDGGAVVINEASGDYDFRVESNGNANAIFVDAGNDKVGIMNASPSATLDVTGSVAASTTVTATTYFLRSVGNALTAAGTTRADALQLAKEVNNITTAAASTGVILPTGVVGMQITVYNNGANSVQVYAGGSETINGTAGSTGVALANAKSSIYHFVAANTWIAVQIN